MSSIVAGQHPSLDAETRVPILVGTAVAFSIASSVVVALRLYTRYAIVHSPGIDDYTIIVADVLAIGVSASTIIQAKNGLGRHSWLVSGQENLAQLKALLAGEVLYNMSQILTKISFLLQYRRIFRDVWTSRICFWMILFLVLWGVAQEFLVGFACIPVSLFEPSLSNMCIYSLIVWYLTSIMNIVTDFIVFLVPIPAVCKLRLPLRQKGLVMSIFCLGFFTCIISIVRLFTLREALNTTDASWDNSPTSWWTTVELNCGILCTSIATLRPLLRRTSPTRRSKDQPNELESHRRQSVLSKGRTISDQPYPLLHLQSGESQDRLKENSEEGHRSVSSYDLGDASRHV